MSIYSTNISSVGQEGYLSNQLFLCRVKDEIFKYRISDDAAQSTQTFLTPQYNDEGKAFVECEGRRKTSTATVKVIKPGEHFGGQFFTTKKFFSPCIFD